MAKSAYENKRVPTDGSVQEGNQAQQIVRTGME